MQAQLTEKERRKWIILATTLPIGSVLSLIHALVTFQRGELLGGWASLLFGLAIFILFGVIMVKPHLIPPVEVVFFFVIASYLLVMTVQSIHSFGARWPGGSNSFLAELNAIVLWYAIVYIASYLALPSWQYKQFMLISLSSLFAALLYHLIFQNGLHAEVVLLWARSLFALFVLVMLITQTGELNKDYLTRDDLTGAYNRRETYAALYRELQRAERYQKSFSIILFDVDYFKNINDTYGHVVGDNVLKKIAAIIKRRTRRTDCFGRWGGEEFLLVLPETDLAVAGAIAVKLCEAIRKERFETINAVTASFGVETYSPGQGLEDMLHAADNALYRAKENGRDQVVISGMDA